MMVGLGSVVAGAQSLLRRLDLNLLFEDITVRSCQAQLDSIGMLEMAINLGTPAKPHINIRVYVGDQCLDGRI